MGVVRRGESDITGEGGRETGRHALKRNVTMGREGGCGGGRGHGDTKWVVAAAGGACIYTHNK